MAEEMNLSIVKLQTEMHYVNEKLDGLDKKLDSFIESADKKYASKNIEYAIYWLIGIVMAGVLTAILTLVLR